MTLLRRRFVQHVGRLLVIALLLVPLAFSGHRHSPTQPNAADGCAICVATHHSPVASAPLIPRPVPVLPVLAVTATAVAAPFVVARPTRSGRAPPFASTSSVA
jgi:hypothetical protein